LSKVGSGWGEYRLRYYLWLLFTTLFILHSMSITVSKLPIYTPYSNTKLVFIEHKPSMIGHMFY
jgi:hypothetical protein